MKMRKIIATSFGLVGILMMLAVAVMNSYIAFFVHDNYTGGMAAASVFWVFIGWIFFYTAIDKLKD